ncbi:hypothetical protein [Vibrio fluvialis]|uniref:hypothetical protein n=1 Tax=Vibrio fluvialis TaxID=676 RepID=UPI001558E02F|nr:hypothetical protein [Vibrio fluvialis]
MEELVKSVQKKYVDDIVNKYPIHRFFVLFIVIIDVHLTFNVKTESVYTTLSEMKVNYLIDVKSGLLSQVSIVQLILSCFLTFVIIAKLNSYFSEFFFKVLSSSQNFDSYTKEISERVNRSKSDDLLHNYYYSKDISKSLNEARAKLNSAIGSCEVLLSLAILPFAGVGNFLFKDYAIVFFFVVCIFYLNWWAFNFYISKFIPYYFTERLLLGLSANFGDK